MSTHRRPEAHESMDYFKPHIQKVFDSNFISTLSKSLSKNLTKLKTLTEEQWNYKYAEGKWTIKEVLIHILDAERIFAYRALRISRNDQLPMQSFEHNDYVNYYEVDQRSPASLLEEYELSRQSTISLFKNMSPEMLDRIGTVSGGNFSALALGFIIAGHEIHHWDILRERYKI